MVYADPPPAPIHPAVKAILYIWIALLVPWLPFAGLAGMAFDAGYVWYAYMFVWAVWSYPITVAIAFFLRRRAPIMCLLPCVNALAFFISGSKP